jgi:hypothetical protein
MAKKQGGSLWDHLGRVRDHRKPKGVRFKLRSILAIAFAAVMAGRKSLAAIARWAERLEEDENKHLLREFGITERDEAPCHTTFHYIFKGLDVKSFENALAAWVKGLVDERVIDHTPIDGKVLRGSRSGETDPVHLLSAYCEELKGVIAQVKVPRGGNEITAAHALLKGIPLNGAIVTGDAILCQRRICRKVVEGGGDYYFAVKENQPGLLRDIELAFEEPVSPLREAKAPA